MGLQGAHRGVRGPAGGAFSSWTVAALLVCCCASIWPRKTERMRTAGVGRERRPAEGTETAEGSGSVRSGDSDEKRRKATKTRGPAFARVLPRGMGRLRAYRGEGGLERAVFCQPAVRSGGAAELDLERLGHGGALSVCVADSG